MVIRCCEQHLLQPRINRNHGGLTMAMTTWDLGLPFVGNYGDGDQWDLGLPFSSGQADAVGTSDVEATGALTTPATQTAGTASQVVTGTGAITTPATQTAGTVGTPDIEATGSATTPATQTAGTASQVVTGTGAITTPAAQTAGTVGTPDVEATGALTTPATQTAGTASQTIFAAGGITLPALHTIGFVGAFEFSAALTTPATQTAGTARQAVTSTTSIAETLLGAGIGLLTRTMGTPKVERWDGSAWKSVDGALCHLRSIALESDADREREVEINDGTITAPLSSATIVRDDRIRVGGASGTEYRAIERMSATAQQQWRITRRVYERTTPDRGRA